MSLFSGFTLLAPAPAIIAAALALPAILALYLLKLRRMPLRVSSILFWPGQATDLQVNVPLRRPSLTWLLLLHLLIACLLILALGRPAALGASGNDQARLILLVDRSASMSARDGRGTDVGSDGTPIPASRLLEAKRRALDLLADLRRGGTPASVALVSFASRPTLLVDFTSNLGTIAAEIESIPPSDQPGDLAEAFKLTAALAGRGSTTEEGAPETPAEIVLFSDGSFLKPPTSDDDTPPSPGGPLRLISCGIGPDASAEPTLTPRTNTGIVALSARPDDADPTLTRVFLRAQSVGPPISPSTPPIPLILSIDGRVVQTIPLAFQPAPANSPREPATSDRPQPRVSEAAASVELRDAAPGVLLASLGVDPLSDLLSADNTASLRLLPRREPRVLCVRPASAISAATNQPTALTPDTFLLDTLRELPLGDLSVVTANSYESMAAGNDLRFFDLIIFDRVTPAATPTLPSLSFAGGMPSLGLIATPSNTSPPSRAIALNWERDHPILRFAPLDRLEALAPLNLRVAAPGLSVRELARGPDGPLILLTRRTAEPDRLFVAFDLTASNWPLDATFPLFVSAAVEFLTAADAESFSRSFTTTQPASIAVRPGNPRLVLQGPVNLTIEVPGAASTPAAPATQAVNPPLALGVIDRAGLYLATEAAADPVLCINLLSPHESRVDTFTQIDFSGTPLPTTTQPSGPRELWRWFVLAAGALLLIEWLLFTQKART